MNVLVIGGNVNSKLHKWLRQLGITQFNHLTTRTSSINPDDLIGQAEQIYAMIPLNTAVISIGPVADKILNMRHIIHGVLPSTRTKNEIEVQKAIVMCKDYLNMRRYYEYPTNPRIG
jgi:hypothetical protein